MFKWIKRIIRTIVETVGIVFDAQQAWSYLGGGGMTTAGTVFLEKIPIIYPIIALVLGSLLIIFGIVRTIIKYHAWKNTTNNPKIDAVMNTGLEYYNCLSKIADKVEKLNRKKNIETNTRSEIRKTYFKMIGITDEILQKISSPQFSFSKKEQRGLFKLFHIKGRGYQPTLDKMKQFAHMMDTLRLGLQDKMEYKKEYDDIVEKLHQQQLELDITGKELPIVDDLRDVIYGCFSVALGVRLLNKHKIWYTKKYATLQSHTALLDKVDNINNDTKKIFDNFYLYTRKQLRKYVMRMGN